MKRFALSTAIILGLAAPAFASNQLAASLGVEPGVYTTSELVQLQRAYENDDETRINFILSGAGGNVVSQTSAGHIQLAADLGVNPADHSFADLVNLREAEENDERSKVAFIRNNVSDNATVSTRSAIGGNAQLAASLGVDAGSFTTAQLIDLRTAMENDEQSRVNFILSQAR